MNAAQGNPSRRKARKLGPTLAALVVGPSPIAPPPILTSPAAIRVWNWLAAELAGLNMLRTTDHAAFARYCQNLADWVEARDDIAAHGYSQIVPTTGGHGTMERFRPSYRVAVEAEKLLRESEDRFGLTPLSRLRMQMIATQVSHRDAAPAEGELFPDAPASEASPVAFVTGGARTH